MKMEKVKTKSSKKSKEIKVRCTEMLLRQLLAICVVTGKSKTTVIEDLIRQEYGRKNEYANKYWESLEEKV